MRFLIVAALCAVLSACSVSPEQSPTDTPETSQTPTQSVTGAFVQDVRSQVGWSGTDNELIIFGELLCTRTGEVGVVGVYDELISIATDETHAYNLGYLYGSAVKYLCPEYESAVRDFLKPERSSV